jgi:hypothetical protein
MEGLLKRVTDYYLKSGDFNGLYFHESDEEQRLEAIGLVRDGYLQVVSEADYLNPHIRPWPSRRSIEDQIADIEALPDSEYGVCLYPTTKALSSRRLGKAMAEQPFTRAMAKGRGTLELAYFRFDVLEPYRNDPRFRFQFYDFGARASVSDEVYLDENEPDSDKILMEHVGFAYDLSQYEPSDPDSPILRRVCAFYGDLAKLSQIHQARWKTYQVEDDARLRPHPVWWGQQMGHWPDGIGPFEKIFAELNAINTLHERAFGQQLFRSSERPDEFGWVLRASQDEFDRFILQLDKILSENLRHEALDLHNVPRKDEQGNNIGSLNRLDRFFEARDVSKDARAAVLKPLKEVRLARQKPAHALRRNVTDRSFIHKQADLLERVGWSLEQLRNFLQTHPANRRWEPPDYLDGKGYRL